MATPSISTDKHPFLKSEFVSQRLMVTDHRHDWLLKKAACGPLSADERVELLNLHIRELVDVYMAIGAEEPSKDDLVRTANADIRKRVLVLYQEYYPQKPKNLFDGAKPAFKPQLMV